MNTYTIYYHTFPNGKNVKDFMTPENYELMLKHRSESLKCKPHKKRKWLTPDGEIKEMNAGNVARFHKDWKEVIE